MKFLFTGDVNFRGHDDIDYDKSVQILSDVIPYTRKVDFVIPNLECPLADKEKFAPIKKAGPNLICAENNIAFLKAINAYAVTLANNHTGDYGDGALYNTLGLLEQNGIAHAGAGKNLTDAYKAIHIEKDGIKVSVISVCENEFGIATETDAGSAGYNPRLVLKQINIEKAYADYIIVVFHGGNEFDPLPSPDTVDRYKLICDMGADAVIAGHTHCPQGYEIYDGKPIIYSMGNFLFKSSSPKDARDSWHYGYMTMLDVTKDGISTEIIPCKFDTDATKITVFEGEDKEKMLQYINRLSEIIADKEKLKLYFMGWTWNHPWCPIVPENFYEIEGFNASGNYDLVKCEAHAAQTKQLLEIFHNVEMDVAKDMEPKVLDLQKMPI